ncbi:MAG: hypothetical protein CSA81_01115 [Acidobacteria bacterium]|nr:MAG: hypothetical protein CSA81_01115 [Acidobacteriota bacterium]
MKIVHLIDHWGLGGAQRAICNLVSLDSENEHLVLSLFSHNKFDWELDFPVEYLGSSYQSLPCAILNLRASLKKHHPDIVHIHLNGSRVAEMFSSLGRRRRYQIVWHEHSGIEPYKIYGRLGGTVLMKIFRTMRNKVTFISNSPHTTEFLRQKLMPDSSAVHTIPCPVNPLSVLQSAPDMEKVPPGCKTDSKPIIGFIGRISPQKGVHQLLEMVKPFLDNSKKAQFWIIGNGPELKQLRMQFSRSTCASQTIFFGERNDVFSIIRNLDVLIMPSQIEPYGLVAIEALLLDRPVVGYSVGGLAEILRKQPLGYPVPLNKINTFRECIETALQKKEHYRESNKDALNTCHLFSDVYKKITNS